MANPLVNEAVRRLIRAGYPEATARRIASGELSMDAANKMARMQEQGFTTPAYSGSTFNIRAFDASRANPESDFGRGAYATTSPLDATANYAGMGPDLTNRVQLESERLADYLVEDEYALEEALSDVGLTLQDFYDDEAAALEAIARSRLVGDAPGGVTYPLRINTQNYAVIGGDNPTVIRQERDYFEEARQSLGEGVDEDEVYDLAYQFQADDHEGLYARIREALADTDAYREEDAINSILEDIGDDLADGEVRVQDIDQAIRRHITEAYDENTGDMLSSGEISAQTLKNLGFEGVIDNTVDVKFGTNRRGFGGAKVPGMTGVTPETQHIITFPGFERNIRSQFAAFDPEQTGSSNILAGLGGAGVVGAGLMAPEEAEAGVLGEIGKRLVRKTSDASKIFGEGAKQITLSDPVSGGSIKLLSRPGEPNSVLSLYVDEEFRGQGIGRVLQDAALAEGPLMGQVSSKAAAVNAYRSGRRPIGNPTASLEDVFAAIDEESSVNMVTSDLLPSKKGALGSSAMVSGASGASASPLDDPERAERRANLRAVQVASDTLERLRRERGAVMSPLQDTRMARFGDYLTENRPSEMDPVQRALQSLGLFQGLGEYLRTTGEGQRTTTMQDINAALDVVPL